MSDEQPFIQIPAPSEEDFRLYEEWLKRNKKDEDQPDEEEKVIIIEL